MEQRSYEWWGRGHMRGVSLIQCFFCMECFLRVNCFKSSSLDFSKPSPRFFKLCLNIFHIASLSESEFCKGRLPPSFAYFLIPYCLLERTWLWQAFNKYLMDEWFMLLFILYSKKEWLLIDVFWIELKNHLITSLNHKLINSGRVSLVDRVWEQKIVLIALRGTSKRDWSGDWRGTVHFLV